MSNSNPDPPPCLQWLNPGFLISQRAEIKKSMAFCMLANLEISYTKLCGKPSGRTGCNLQNAKFLFRW